MFIDYTPEQKALKAEIRSTMDRLMTPALKAELVDQEGGGPEYYKAMEALAELGWLGFGWPEEAGGMGRPAIEEFIFFDEMHRSGFPIPLLTLCTVGPTLAQAGSPEQKARYLPEILAGKHHFAIGYTEPSAGTDLASLTTTAVRDGDDYVINGQKVYCSLADFADTIWTAVRTGEPGSRHRGISVILIPKNAEGVSHTPIRNLGDSNIHAVYFEDVRVPVTNRVGEENAGWKLVTAQLNHERVALMMVGPLARLTAEVRDWAASQPDGKGGVLLDTPWVRRNLARVDAGLELLRLQNWRQAWKMDHGALNPADASGIKVYGSEFYIDAHRWLLEVLGAVGPLKHGSPAAVLEGHLERHARATRVLTFGGGTNEVQRDIIGMAGLRLPRQKR